MSGTRSNAVVRPDYSVPLSRLANGHAHRFRHTLGENLLAKGVSMENVAKILGNTLRIVEKHYSTFSQARQDALTAEIEKAWKLS
jgi:site-specific recombinase XerD